MHFTDTNEQIAELAEQLGLCGEKFESLDKLIKNGVFSTTEIYEAMKLIPNEDGSLQPITETELLNAQQTLLGWNERLAS